MQVRTEIDQRNIIKSTISLPLTGRTSDLSPRARIPAPSFTWRELTLHGRGEQPAISSDETIAYLMHRPTKIKYKN